MCGVQQCSRPDNSVMQFTISHLHGGDTLGEKMALLPQHAFALALILLILYQLFHQQILLSNFLFLIFLDSEGRVIPRYFIIKEYIQLRHLLKILDLLVRH